MRWSSALVAVTSILALVAVGLDPVAMTELLRYALLGAVGVAAVLAYLFAP